jgi:hypothetical protein
VWSQRQPADCLAVCFLNCACAQVWRDAEVRSVYVPRANAVHTARVPRALPARRSQPPRLPWAPPEQQLRVRARHLSALRVFYARSCSSATVSFGRFISGSCFFKQ